MLPIPENIRVPGQVLDLLENINSRVNRVQHLLLDGDIRTFINRVLTREFSAIKIRGGVGFIANSFVEQMVNLDSIISGIVNRNDVRIVIYNIYSDTQSRESLENDVYNALMQEVDDLGERIRITEELENQFNSANEDEKRSIRDRLTSSRNTLKSKVENIIRQATSIRDILPEVVEEISSREEITCLVINEDGSIGRA